MDTFFKYINKIWQASRIALPVVSLIVLVAIFAGDFIPKSNTYGKIWVDSPEVYTRERLVNDRFLQGAWLKNQLKQNSEFAGTMGVLRKRTASNLSLNANAEQNPELLQQELTPQTSISARDTFADQVDFRERVRNLQIENQLDDRHDLDGNALYRLKFDVSIIPGEATRAPAQIKVTLKGPKFKKSNDQPVSTCIPSLLQDLGSKDEIEHWRQVYKHWLSSLQSRLNSAHRELKQTYYRKEFKNSDYAKFFDFFATNYGLSTSNVKDQESTLQCKTKKPSNNPQAKNNLTENPPVDHKIQQKCVRALVFQLVEERRSKEKTLKEKAPSRAVVSNNDTTITNQGNYESPIGDPGPINSSKLDVSKELDKSLNTFFASKALQLVLAIDIPPQEFINEKLYLLNQLEPLSKISFFSSTLDNPDFNVFTVKEKTLVVNAINKKTLKEDAYVKWKKAENINNLNTQENKTFQKEYANYTIPVLPSDHTKENKNIVQARMPMENIPPLVACEFRPIKKPEGAFIANVEVGLHNFSEKIRLQSKTYAYAVTPKERADSELATFERTARATANNFMDSNINLQTAQAVMSRSINRRGTTVGFATAKPPKEEAIFGWVISPRMSINNNERIHTPAQQSLSALISLPAWWRSAQLKVTTSWLDSDGNSTKTNEYDHEITLVPVYEPLESALLQLQHLGPELMESMLDPIELTACKSGAIVIPGRRLWRSTVVTLGYQKADEISVLPNMKGIIAKFKEIEDQSNVANGKGKLKEQTTFKRKVRVWTSQGSVTLPDQATIGISKFCRNQQALKSNEELGQK